MLISGAHSNHSFLASAAVSGCSSSTRWTKPQVLQADLGDGQKSLSLTLVLRRSNDCSR